MNFIDERNALAAELDVLRNERDELTRLMNIEWKAVGHSDAWEEMAGKADDLGAEIGEKMTELREAEAHIPYRPEPWAPCA